MPIEMTHTSTQSILGKRRDIIRLSIYLTYKIERINEEQQVHLNEGIQFMHDVQMLKNIKGIEIPFAGPYEASEIGRMDRLQYFNR